MTSHSRPLRIMMFILILLVTLILSTGIVIFAVVLASDYGLVIVKAVEITAPAVVAAILGITGLVGAIIAFDRNMLEARALRARFAFDLNQAFFENPGERHMFYQIEHSIFVFDADTFRGSENERHLDGILYRLSLVGKLLSDGVLEIGDIQFIKHITQSVLADPEVLKYLAWLKSAAPDHLSFVNAIYLYKEAHGKDDTYASLKHYLGK